MTQWRDARLARALDHAPDAQQQPAAATRAAILQQARDALAAPATPARAATPRPAGVWWRWFNGGPRSPWNAAFASVLLAGVITSLWWDREVPGPAPEPGTRPAESAAPPPPAGPAPQVAAAPAPAAPEAARREREALARDRAAAARQAEERASQRAEAQARKSFSQAPARPPAAPPPALPQRDDAADAAAPRQAEAAAPAPAPALPTPAPAPPAPAAPPPAAAAAPGTATLSAPAAAAPTVRQRLAAPVAEDWNAWRLASGTGTPMARSTLAPELAQALDGLLRAGPGAGADPQAATMLSVELLRGGTVLGRLDLGTQSLRWAPTHGGLPAAFSAPLEPALSARLREALGR